MKVVMLGTGAAIPDADRNDSSIVINVHDKWYMFDCGAGATQQMVRGHMDPTLAEAIFCLTSIMTILLTSPIS